MDIKLVKCDGDEFQHMKIKPNGPIVVSRTEISVILSSLAPETWPVPICPHQEMDSISDAAGVS